jgi:mannosyltransferase OCH1-like enzyme
MIPKVHQIVFSDLPQVCLSGYAEMATKSVREAFPQCDYKLWRVTDASTFIADHYNDDVLDAFNRLKPYAYKADLFKYCILQTLGGWYIDAGVALIKSPAPLFGSQYNPDFVLFRSTGKWDAPWNCSLAFVYAEPGHPVFTTAINLVIHNCRNNFYGENPLSPTMSPFGRAIAAHNVYANTKIGLVVDVNAKNHRRGFLLPPLGVVGLRKPIKANVGDVEKIGIAGSNNYAEMWRQRIIYA